MPAAEKEQRTHTSDRDHVCVLSHEKARKLHAAVFSMEARYQFVLRFGQIERHAIRFSERGNQKDEEAEDLRPGSLKNHPVRKKAQDRPVLGISQFPKAQG